MPTALVAPRPPARFTPADLTCPPVRPWDVVTQLLDFAIVTYAVEPSALAALLAPGVEPDVVTLDDGRRVALVSAVPFRDRDFRFAFAPFARFHFGQTNYRAYVRFRGERAVWFFGTSLATRWVAVPQLAWRLPWHHARIHFDTAYEGERCVRYALRTRAAWGEARLTLTGSDAPMGRLDGFADAEETAVVLTHPLVGLYHRRDGQLGSYSVWHDRLRLQRAHATEARFHLFERLGLVAPGAAPHSVLVQRETEFVVRLPPGLVREAPVAARPALPA